MGKLDGKVAIITGGARGQGEAHARLCVEEGARVVIGDVLDDDGQRVAVELGSMARYVHLDVSRADNWANAVSVAESMGPLRVLVNNAAIHWTRPIEFETAEGFEKIWRVNLLGAFLGIKAAIEPMRRAGGGSIINISSTAGLTGLAYHGAYGSAKWGMRGLTRTAAVELGRDGIRVNSVHPGITMTPLIREGLQDYAASGRFASAKAAEEEIAAMGALGITSDPEDTAHAFVYLASEEARFVTGASIYHDGAIGQRY